MVADGDACCPAGASEATDSDCIQVCGDGIIAGAEQCEPDVLISQTCSQFGYAGGEPTCLSNCQLSTLTCTGGHTLSFEKISNFILVGDIAHIVWHGSGEWALLVAQNGTLAQYDAASGAVVALPALEGTPRDVGRSSDGESILIAGTSGDAAVVWRVEEDEQAGVIISLWELPLIGTEATCVVPSPTDAEWTVCTRVNNTGGYINRLYRISDIDGVLGSTAYASGSGISDAMWTTTAYPGSNAIVSTEGLNGAGSQSWVLASDITVGNGWSPGFGNAGRAEWRPNGEYGIAVGTSTNSVYVFDGAWQSTKTPSANNGATGNAIAWTADGARALVVARPTGAPLEGSVFDFRPGGTNQYDSAHWYNASIPLLEMLHTTGASIHIYWTSHGARHRM